MTEKTGTGGALHVALSFAPNARRAVGRLAAQGGRIYFEWDRGFLAAPLPLSPFRMAPRAGVIEGPAAPWEGLHGLFADSLPDAWGRLLIDRARRRDGRRPAGMLDYLRMVGENGPGALSYSPADASEAAGEAPNLDALADDADAIFADADDPAALERLRRVAGSSGGARPKALLHLDPQGRWHGRPAPDREAWIVKFRGGDDPEDIGAIEAAYADLAREAGLTVAPTRLFPSKRGPGWFGTRRFDRQQGEAGWTERPHMHSLAGLLNADFRIPSVGYDALIKAARLLTRLEAEAEAAFRLMVFNVIAHNRDDHAKNVAFLMSAEGDWRLAPAYDLTFAEGPGGEHAMDVMGEGRAPGRADMLRVAAASSIRPKRAADIIDAVAQAMTGTEAALRTAGVSRASAATIGARVAAALGRASA